MIHVLNHKHKNHTHYVNEHKNEKDLLLKSCESFGLKQMTLNMSSTHITLHVPSTCTTFNVSSPHITKNNCTYHSSWTCYPNIEILYSYVIQESYNDMISMGSPMMHLISYKLMCNMHHPIDITYDDKIHTQGA